MKIKVADLTTPLVVKIEGQEDWLKETYGYFPTPIGETTPLIKGELTLSPESYGWVAVKGSLDYEPFLDCSRCGEPLRWAIKRNLDVIYRVPNREELSRNKERELTAKEMDEYWIENGEIDLQSLVNEEVQLGVPTQTVTPDQNNVGCRRCEASNEGGLVFGSDSEAKDNPFAVLKNLKLPH